MKNVELRDADERDFDCILALNHTEVQQTSTMDLARLTELSNLASYHRVAIVDGQVAGFLLAFRDHAGYSNVNYEWFSARFSKLMYIDRIVVSADYAGLRIGSLLYQDLFRFALSHDVRTIVCEYNIQPPNLASQAFHDKFGFKEIGSQWIANGSKCVSLQVLEI